MIVCANYRPEEHHPHCIPNDCYCDVWCKHGRMGWGDCTDCGFDEAAMKSPPSIEILGLRWEYNPNARRFHRFGVGDGCRGVGNCANPVTAYLALRRWRKVPPTPTPFE